VFDSRSSIRLESKQVRWTNTLMTTGPGQERTLDGIGCWRQPNEWLLPATSLENALLPLPLRVERVLRYSAGGAMAAASPALTRCRLAASQAIATPQTATMGMAT
jgi:hypothetical protein